MAMNPFQSPEEYPERPPRGLILTIVGLLVIQYLCVAVMVFGDIGFDHPGRFGLDFDHLVLLVLFYLGVLAFGVLLCVQNRAWLLLAPQAVFPLGLAAFAGWNVFVAP